MTTWKFLYRLYRCILPEVHQYLAHWKQKALQIPDEELRQQALASIRDKTFHCEGGAVYVAAMPEARHILIPLIVAFQTISDYLDNLCDRSTSLDPDDFYCLHESMLDAVSLKRPLKDYYQVRKNRGESFQDGGYLQQLVQTCRERISLLPNYHMVEVQILTWVGLYRDLQVHKHVRPEEREQRLLQWWKEHESEFPELQWNEFAAATGSTLGVFSFFLVACQQHVSVELIDQQRQAYFPWICATHILLDYLIDLQEDELGGDLNFISYYDDRNDMKERLKWLAKRARDEASRLSGFSSIHSMVVDGLFGMYLADGKVHRQPLVTDVARSLLKKSSWRVWLFYCNSKLYRGNQAQIQPTANREVV